MGNAIFAIILIKGYIMQKNNIIATLLLSFTISSMAVEWEVGFGPNYGGLLGVTINHIPANDTELYAGLALVGGVLGTRYYIDENVRLNLNYGVNGYRYNTKNGEDFISTYHGFNLGLDYIWNNGFNLGITVALSQKAYNTNKSKILNTYDETTKIIKDDNSKPSKIGLSLGYRF